MKNKKGLFVIILSMTIIIIGAVLLFINNKEDEKEDSVISRPFTAVDVRGIIYESMIANKGEMWNIGDTQIVAHNINNSKYLVHYIRVLENGLQEEYESIVTIDKKKSIEFPGWRTGEKNLDEYGFIYYGTEKK